MDKFEVLSEEERAEFKMRFEQRVAKVDAKLEDVYAFNDVDAPPFLVNAAFYHLFGMDLETVPENYIEDPAVMTAVQERGYFEQIRAVDDDFVPSLIPWLGTGVVAFNIAPARVLLCDTNPHLVNFYNAVASDSRKYT